MNRHQQALNRIVKSCCPNCIDENGCSSCDIEKVCNATAKSWVDTLQKLINEYNELKSLLEEYNIDKSNIREMLMKANMYKEKETPIKTVGVETEPCAYYGMCDSCGSGIRLCQHYDNEKEKWVKQCYCPYCGQKLDWSDKDGNS